ncbi:MAG: VCBS repeat-containing protein, partial [Deltaproteobacteria bacterium]|nr:VCBS repeat-containing protein [Deltaproteobacteria bacterium]
MATRLPLVLLLLVPLAAGCPVSDDDDASNDDDTTVADDDDAAGEAWFEDVTEQAGVVGGPPGGGCGIAVGDANGDGLPDFYVSQIQTRGLLYVNDGNGGFDELSNQSGLFREGNQNFGAAFIDVDGDGDQDLIRANAGPNQVLLNASGYFALSADALGFEGDRASVNTAFADMDGDGDLDLYLTNGALDYGPEVVADEDQLYRNDGGTFVDISDVLPPLARRGFGFVSGWTDTDHDGDLDIYVVNDFGFVISNQLFVNEGPSDDGGAWDFTVATDTCNCAITEAGMGLAIGDVDRDGWQDFYLSNGAREQKGSIVGEFLLRNAGDNSFIDVSLANGAVAASIPDRQSSWGLDWIDVDNDGWLDAIIPY